MAALEEPLGSGLVLRTVRDERDAERYIALSRAVVNEAEGAYAARVLRHRPGSADDDFMLVEDTHTGEVVSTTCLMPWQVRCDGVTLRLAMLEMVVTHPAYRRHGLVRAQLQHFHTWVAERGFDAAIIQGIPYYYRQYGYAYALDHTPHDALQAWRIPDPPPSSNALHMRVATVEDAAELTCLYRRATDGLQICTLRDEAYWRYLLQSAGWVVQQVDEAHTGRCVGYFGTRPAAQAGIEVTESALFSLDAAWAALLHVRAKAVPTADIRLGGPESSALVRLGRSLGSVSQPAYQWLLRIGHPHRLLIKLGPAFERRLAASECAGLTADVCLNFFRQAFLLRFQGGRLDEVVDLGFVDASLGADGGDACIPPEAFVRLAFGYRSLDELRDAWPDLVVKPERRRILEVLFPRLTSWVSMPY